MFDFILLIFVLELELVSEDAEVMMCYIEVIFTQQDIIWMRLYLAFLERKKGRWQWILQDIVINTHFLVNNLVFHVEFASSKEIKTNIAHTLKLVWNQLS